ncbi:Xpo1-domain-containing protein [Ascobolus immersus RN42]|uniref:Exportin-T n=1 Tax=Ascobolus immersus RN42 TaxID=1160509 RepID=A0A3N4HNJ1_ASCIM|nr:Xpo1-domain-containing protein [Ascobolus immersus RN42]
MEYLTQVKDSVDGWHGCLQLFPRRPPADEFTRIYTLDVINAAIHRNDPQTIAVIKDEFLRYVRQNYTVPSVTDSNPIQNKVAQTFTLLFLASYTTTWTSFFDDILALTYAGGSEGQRDNKTGVWFFLRVMISVHDEIADVLVARTQEDAARNQTLKDVIRGQDVNKLVTCCNQILTQYRSSDKSIVDACLRVIGKWVTWIDIGLVVNQTLVGFLYEIISSEGELRETAIVTLTEIASKKMPGQAKLELINFLGLDSLLAGVAAGLETSSDDTTEAISKLVNVVGIDIVKIYDSSEGDLRAAAATMLEKFFQYMMPLFRNEYDDISREVLPFITELLTAIRKEKRMVGFPNDSQKQMLPIILNAVLIKMKYSSETEWGSTDEESEEAEFQEFRKALKILQESIAVIDEPFFLSTLRTEIGGIFQQLKTPAPGKPQPEWRDLEFALHEMYLLGETGPKASGPTGGLFVKNKPLRPIAETLAHLLTEMMTTNIFKSVHPAIQLKYAEILVRYASFFELFPEHIPRALEDFIGAVHSSHVRVRNRSWYLFMRFIKTLRTSIQDSSVIEQILGSIADLLVVKVQLAELDYSTDGSDEASEDSTFESQIHLFEAVGYLASAHVVTVEKQVLYANTVMTPIFNDISNSLDAAKNGDKLAVLQVHHDIRALATLARGFSEWAPGTKSGAKPPAPELSDEFEKAAEAIIVSLENLGRVQMIRDAARASFTRLVGVLGARVLKTLPRWIDGLLATTSSRSEIGMFLRLLVQVAHNFRVESYTILDTIMSPLLQRIFAAMSEPVTGTDDGIQLTELRREYVQFVLHLLNNDLGSIFVSETNQPIFEQIIQTVEHFARDYSDPNTQKQAINVFSTMCRAWGPNPVYDSTTTVNGATVPSTQASQTSNFTITHKPLPGFDQFMMDRFSLICWEISADPAFKLQDAQSKQLLGEIATLQKTIYLSVGDRFSEYLRTAYFPRIGLPDAIVSEFLEALQKLDQRDFKNFFRVCESIQVY